MQHRVALRTSGLTGWGRGAGRPVIGIADSSDLNPRNLPLRVAGRRRCWPGHRGGGRAYRPSSHDLARRGSDEAGRHALPQPAGDRDRGDDPQLPAGLASSILGQLRQDGTRRDHGRGQRGHPRRWWSPAAPCEPAIFRGERSAAGNRRCGGCGTSGARARVSDAEWRDLEAAWIAARRLQHDGHGVHHGADGRGARPDDPGIEHDSVWRPGGAAAAHQAGRRAGPRWHAELLALGRAVPRRLGNAVRVLHAVGGSTNAVIHLPAIAGRAGRAAAPWTIWAASAPTCRCWPTSSPRGRASCRTSTRPAGCQPCWANWTAA